MSDPVASEAIRLVKAYRYDEKKLRQIIRENKGDALRRKLLDYVDVLSDEMDRGIDERFNKKYGEALEEMDNLDLEEFEREARDKGVIV